MAAAAATPPGYAAIAPLAAADAATVDGAWQYRFATSLPFVREAIVHRPSGGVVALPAAAAAAAAHANDADGGPTPGLVGWAITRADWSVGLVHVLEAHRGRGLAKAVVHTVVGAMRRAVPDPRARPHVHVMDDNIPSRRVHEALGFVRRGLVHWAHVDLGAGAP